MWLLLKGPTGHLRSHGQHVNNFKSHSPTDFWSGKTMLGTPVHFFVWHCFLSIRKSFCKIICEGGTCSFPLPSLILILKQRIVKSHFNIQEFKNKNERQIILCIIATMSVAFTSKLSFILLLATLICVTGTLIFWPWACKIQSSAYRETCLTSVIDSYTLLVLMIKKERSHWVSNFVWKHIPQTDHLFICVISNYLVEATTLASRIIISRIFYYGIEQC